MGLLQRLTGYASTWTKTKAEQAMDPEIELEQAISEARQRDQQLRNQAAKVVAHRALLDQRIDDAADDVEEAKDLAKQALRKAQEAQQRQDAAEADRWNRSASTLALRLQAAEQNLASLREQYSFAVGQAEDAKQAVQQNAMRLEELASRRMQMLGSLQQARMQESVNSAVEGMHAAVDDDGPSLDRVEDKIDGRLAEARARAELRSATPEGTELDLRESMMMSKAESRLDELKAELGMGPGTSGELTSGSAS